ncbi:riboflavin synthase subunit alpha [Bacterioplanoides sp.]|uniref:riboflavin synthase subunit alpha n=1 Tax=Bacterioplanoides sp. TaxID=2066072 RepID=UPI003B5968AD
MFTGIVQTKLPVAEVLKAEGLTTFVFEFDNKLLTGLETGASVAINGTCLTVRSIDGNRVYFDAIAQTLKVTNLGQIEPGSVVNLERAAKYGDEIGGHVVSGHVMDQVRVVDVVDSANNRVVWMQRPKALAPYLLDKGFVALNGCSLTIAEVKDDRFAVHLIPETLDITVFGGIVAGDSVNLEIDAQTQAVVDTVRRLIGNTANLKELITAITDTE